MQRIILCEDKRTFLDELRTIVQNYLMIEELPIEVFGAYTNPQHCIDDLNQNFHAGDLYFLDINLSHTISGLKLAKWIRNREIGRAHV